MIIKSYYRIILLCILISFSECCKQSLPTGDITGRVILTNCDNSQASDRSGVEIKLYKDTILEELTHTNAAGTYFFKDKIYDKYRVAMNADKYMLPSKYSSGYSFYHIGGESPTIVSDITFYEIPAFTLTVDSVKVSHNGDYPVIMYIKINGGGNMPNALLVGFCSDKKDVSIDNYVAIARGGFRNYAFTSEGLIRIPVWAFFDSFGPSFNQLITSDTIYTRLYPIASGQDLYKPINRLALGKPSDVIGFVW